MVNNPQSQTDALLSIYHAAFEHSKQGFCLLEKIDSPASAPPDFYYRLTNLAFDHQIALQQGVGKTFRQRFYKAENHMLMAYNQVALTGRPTQVETYMAALDRWFTVDAFRVGDFEPPWVGVLFTDTTERKRREANLAFLAEVSQDLALLTNIDQTMNALGQKIAAYLGLSASSFAELHAGAQPDALTAVISHGWYRNDVPSHLGTYRMEEFMTPEVMELCLAGKEVVIRDVFEDPRTDGLQFAALQIGSFISMPLVREGQWRFLLVVYRSEPHDWGEDEIELTRELTTRIWARLERARAEEALRLEYQRKDEFMAMLGHELRNPLGVLSNILLLLDITQGQDVNLSYAVGVQRMRQQVKHLGRMVDDLLDISRIRQGKIRLRRLPIELTLLVKQTLEAAQSLFAERNQTVDIALPLLPLIINGDTTRIAQALMNLLTNAAKYTDEGGHIWISLEEQSGQAVLTVRDNGMGIPAEELTAIFEVFVQGDTSLDRPRGGLGLGLAVVKQIVEGHQGRIEAQSPGPGQGNSFTVTLPLVVEEQFVTQPAHESSLVHRDALRVLLVDDNKELIDLMGWIMQRQGYEVHLRYSGQEGIAAAEALVPDVMLVDIGMPQMDGYAVCQYIRRQAWGQNLPIIALTGFGREADKQRSWASGFDGHLLKPVDYTSLPEVLTKTITAKKECK